MTGETNKTLRALVVEDSDIGRMVYKARFRQIGYDVVETASNFQEAVRILEKRQFDVYLVDGRFPNALGEEEVKGNGLKLQPQVLRYDPLGRFILFSGDENLVKKAEKQGIEAYYKNGDVCPFDLLKSR